MLRASRNTSGAIDKFGRTVLRAANDGKYYPELVGAIPQ
jgi:hypothetical protein